MQVIPPLRSAYRAIVPRGIRRLVRARLVASPPRRPEPGPRRFELPLPRPAEGPEWSPSRRASLVIEAPRTLYVPRLLHRGGLAAYEPETAALLLGVAEHLRPTAMFDVGANVGPHALVIAAVLDVPVVAFEPAAEVAAVLRQLVAINAVRCTVEETAVGERDGTATLFISPTDTSTSLRAGFREPTAETTVPVISLDSYVATSGLRPGLLKIDTETTEAAVLRGAAELLRTRPWIVCEILPGWDDDPIDEILRPLGYRAFQIVDDVPFPERETIGEHAELEARNWLFAPEAPDRALWDAVARWRRAIDRCDPPRNL